MYIPVVAFCCTRMYRQTFSFSVSIISLDVNSVFAGQLICLAVKRCHLNSHSLRRCIHVHIRLHQPWYVCMIGFSTWKICWSNVSKKIFGWMMTLYLLYSSVFPVISDMSDITWVIVECGSEYDGYKIYNIAWAHCSPLHVYRLNKQLAFYSVHNLSSPWKYQSKIAIL